ncbi:MAG TPA: (2Fe-2S) ferredoxin domain-containing protein [Thermoanaerobaculia bacterium]|nr:(2Fe-2S) ferredoxin domain-containing protein [Thermoanaerobaculia bacterium]
MKYPFERHFLVCTGPRCSDERSPELSGHTIQKLLKAHNKALGRKPIVRVCAVSCLDLCEQGPNMVIWPQGDVHSGLDPATALRIYSEEMGDEEKDSDE